jgi:GAF domain-containing protein
MARARLLPVLTALGRFGSNGAASWTEVCVVCAKVLEVTDVGVMLMPDGSSATTLGAAGPVGAALEEAQFTFGEGPCIDAYHSQRPVEAPDLAMAPATGWTAFTDRAVELGVRSLLALPLRVGAARLGSMDVYREQPGVLADERFADALAVADLISFAILAMQAHAPLGHLAEELDGTDGQGARSQIHQASGVVAAQLHIGVADALVRLRAHAYASGHSIDDVAAQVIDGTLRLADDGG